MRRFIIIIASIFFVLSPVLFYVLGAVIGLPSAIVQQVPKSPPQAGMTTAEILKLIQEQQKNSFVVQDRQDQKELDPQELDEWGRQLYQDEMVHTMWGIEFELSRMREQQEWDSLMGDYLRDSERNRKAGSPGW